MTPRSLAQSRKSCATIALLLAPTLSWAILFIAVPFVLLVVLTTLSWDVLTPARYVGADNWIAVFQDGLLFRPLLTTMLMSLLVVIPLAVLGLGLAILIRQSGTWATTLWSLVLIPWLLAPIAVGMVWRWVLKPEDGLLATMSGQRVEWIVSTNTALVVLAGVLVWNHVGYVALIWNVGLTAIDQHYRDQATIDGANAAGTLWWVELPLLRQHTLFILVTTFFATTAVFDQIVVLTGGGPEDATRTMSVAIFEEAFISFNMGVAATLALFLVIVQAATVLLLTRVSRLRVVARDGLE